MAVQFHNLTTGLRETDRRRGKTQAKKQDVKKQYQQGRIRAGELMCHFYWPLLTLAFTATVTARWSAAGLLAVSIQLV